MKRIYIAMETMNKDTRKYYPVVCPVSVESSDIIAYMNHYAGSNIIIGSLVCSTKKRAVEIVESWREAHKREGNIDDLLLGW